MAVSFQVYVSGWLTFFGWILLIIFGGAGIVGIPFDLINAWRNRPRIMDENVFRERKEYLSKGVEELVKIGKELVQDNKEAEKDSSICGGFIKHKILSVKQREYEVQCMLAEKEFDRLEKSASYYSKVEPMTDTIKLLAGLASIFITMAILIHIMVYILLQINDKSIHPFFNQTMQTLDELNLSFISNALFCFVGFYFMAAAVMGNIKFGLRIYSVPFFPMV